MLRVYRRAVCESVYTSMRGWRTILWRLVHRGKGVLVLTGHLGAWELVEFLSLAGWVRPMGMVIRRLDNPLVDRICESTFAV